MTLIEWVTIGTAAGMMAGTLIGYGIVWGTKKTALNGLWKSHANLEVDVKAHHENLDKHIDPKRDALYFQTVLDSQNSGFSRVVIWLEKIDARREARGTTCAWHFLKIEKKVAAISGKGNGDE